MISREDMLVQMIGNLGFGSEYAKCVARILNGSGASNVKLLDLKIRPACATCVAERTAHLLRAGVKKDCLNRLCRVRVAASSVRAVSTEWSRPTPKGACLSECQYTSELLSCQTYIHRTVDHEGLCFNSSFQSAMFSMVIR